MLFKFIIPLSDCCQLFAVQQFCWHIFFFFCFQIIFDVLTDKDHRSHSTRNLHILLDSTITSFPSFFWRAFILFPPILVEKNLSDTPKCVAWESQKCKSGRDVRFFCGSELLCERRRRRRRRHAGCSGLAARANHPQPMGRSWFALPSWRLVRLHLYTLPIVVVCSLRYALIALFVVVVWVFCGPAERRSRAPWSPGKLEVMCCKQFDKVGKWFVQNWSEIGSERVESAAIPSF